MNELFRLRFLLPILILSGAPPTFAADAARQSYQLKPGHPRLFIDDLQEVVTNCAGPLVPDYQVVKLRADNAVRRGGIEFISNAWSIPEDLMNCGLAYLVEREMGHDCLPYARVIVKQWGADLSVAHRGRRSGK
jgi:hypothetical protein